MGEERAERIRQRLELVEREGELRELLRRTRFTAPVWSAGVVFFLWSGWSTGSWPPALTLGAFAAVAAAVNLALRRRRMGELAAVHDRLEALPPADPDEDRRRGPGSPEAG